MARYTYKSNRILPSLDPQSVGEELERIRDSNGGNLTTKVVVKESRPKKAVLHGEFEWRDKVAAEKYRHYQARNIVNVVQVIPEPVGDMPDRGKPIQAFVHTVEGAASDQESKSYKPIAVVLADHDLRVKLVQRCLEKLVRVRNEFAALQEYASLWAQIDALAVE